MATARPWPDGISAAHPRVENPTDIYGWPQRISCSLHFWIPVSAMDKLPTQSRSEGHRRKPATSKFCLLAAFCIASSLIYTSNSAFTLTKREHLFAKSSDAQNILRRCWQLNVTPGPPKDFNLRTVSDRYEPGTPTILLKNATIWTGRDSGTNVIQGDLLLDKGIIKAVGDIVLSDLHDCEALEVIDLHGAWVTPG